jgi:hypothetical protein
MRRILLAGSAALTLATAPAYAETAAKPKMQPSQIIVSTQDSFGADSSGGLLLGLFLILLILATSGGGGSSCPTCG